MSVLHVTADENGAHVPITEWMRLAGFEDTPEKREEVVRNLNRIAHDAGCPEFAFAIGDGQLHASPDLFGGFYDEWETHERKRRCETYFTQMATVIRQSFRMSDIEEQRRLRAAAIVTRLREHVRVAPNGKGVIYEGDLDAFTMEELHFLIEWAREHPVAADQEDYLMPFLQTIFEQHLQVHREENQLAREIRKELRRMHRIEPEPTPVPRCSTCNRKPAHLDGKCKKCLRAEGLLPAGKIT